MYAISLMILGMLCVFAIVAFFLFSHEKQRAEESLDRQAEILASSLSGAIWTFNEGSLETIARAFSASEDIAFIKIEDLSNTIPPYLQENPGAQAGHVSSKPIFHQGKRIGTIELALSTLPLDGFIRDFLMFGGVAVSILILITAFGIQRAVKIHLAQPLAKLLDWMSSVKSSKYQIIPSEIDLVELKPIAVGLKEMAETISKREEELIKLSLATENSPASIVITDPEGYIEYTNHALEQISGFDSLEVHGKKLGHVYLDREDSPDAAMIMESVAKGAQWNGETTNRRKDGELYQERVQLVPIHNADNQLLHTLIISEDITLQKEQEQQIHFQAHYDQLTHLPNRFLSLDRLGQMIKKAGREASAVALLFLDLDDFKKINDHFGHAWGDRLLNQAAEKIKRLVRETDTVGRLGGDEFLIILSDLADPIDASRVAETIVEAFRRPFKVESKHFHLTASIGVAIFPRDGATPSQLLQHADMAMYHTKAQGRSGFSYFDRAMNEKIVQRLKIEERLRDAVAHSALEVHFQPIFNADSREVSAAEALIRWTDRELGQVSPAEFIPIAEQTGLIFDIGHFVLKQAIEFARQGTEKFGPGFQVAINLSPVQFEDERLIETVSGLLKTSGVSGASVVLEITEGVLINQNAEVLDIMHDLRELGINFSMDDFGTGYSSLNYLLRYPFSTLKIDRSFVKDLGADPAAREVINAIIRMAQALGLQVVAEGVETEEQLNQLADFGCNKIQGFLLGKAMRSQLLLNLDSPT